MRPCTVRKRMARSSRKNYTLIKTKTNNMKYPRIQKEKIDYINRKRFDALYSTLLKSITFDNKENELNLTKSDIEILAWNASVVIITKPY